jgi:transposase
LWLLPSSTIDIPQMFKNSKSVGAVLGLTPHLNESGESKRIGGISCFLSIKAWAMSVAKRRSRAKAITALARRLAVVMHRMWSNNAPFNWTREELPSASHG